MIQASTKQDIISKLRKDLLVWEGFKPPVTGSADSLGLGPVAEAFPNGIFPKSGIHEFISDHAENGAATGGFIAGLLKSLMKDTGTSLWISRSRTLFPPSLKIFGVQPDKVIFVDLQRDRDILWATEEALKCEGITAVITEIGKISFTESRRLQLAVEKSRVTGFVIRTGNEKVTSTACTARWQITPLPSLLPESMPGVGMPRWDIELLKVRNGNPGRWQMEWAADHFEVIMEQAIPDSLPEKSLKAG